jgi:hypothetical protein
MIFRLLHTFQGVRHLRVHGKVNVVEILKYLDMARETIGSLEINEANVDLIKLFKHLHKIKPGVAEEQKQIAWKSA